MLFYNHADGGEDVLVQQTAARWMREQGCRIDYRVPPGFQHAALPAPLLAQTSQWLLGHRRSVTPRIVHCVVDGYENTSKYWVTIDAFKDRRGLASLDATVDGDSIIVRTDGNVAAYTLDLAHAPIPAAKRRLQILEDGRDVGLLPPEQSQRSFRRLPNGAAEARLRKRPRLAGPIASALADRRFLVVINGFRDHPRDRTRATPRSRNRLGQVVSD